MRIFQSKMVLGEGPYKEQFKKTLIRKGYQAHTLEAGLGRKLKGDPLISGAQPTGPSWAQHNEEIGVRPFVVSAPAGGTTGVSCNQQSRFMAVPFC